MTNPIPTEVPPLKPGFGTLHWFSRVSILEWLCLAGGVFFCFQYAWLLDDSFIYFRYADNALFLERGLVYNSGEYVEGFSSPFWMILLLALRQTGLDFWVIIQLVAGLSYLAFWFLLVQTNRDLSPRSTRFIFNFPLLLLSCLYGVSSYLTSGTESPLVLLVAIAFAAQIVRPASAPLQIIIGLSPLIRHELVIPMIIIILWTRWKSSTWPWKTILTGFTGLASLTFFRIYYFADLFPTTFYLKDEMNLRQGIIYVHETFGTYHLYEVLLLFLVLAMIIHRRRASGTLRIPERLVMVLTVLPIVLYVIRIGGDARHFRYLTFSFCLLACTCAGLIEHTLEQWQSRFKKTFLTVLGVATMLFSISCYPPQWDHHPFFSIEGHTKIDEITDGRHQMIRDGLIIEPWHSSASIEQKSSYRQYMESPEDFPTRHAIVTGHFCLANFRQFNKAIIHSLGLTDPILARVKTPSSSAGHKWGLVRFSQDLLQIRRLYQPQPGSFRRAVDQGVAAAWIRRNIDSIEVLERKMYNRHHFLENLSLALTFPPAIDPHRKPE